MADQPTSSQFSQSLQKSYTQRGISAKRGDQLGPLPPLGGLALLVVSLS
jgi:hypothetical protein